MVFLKLTEFLHNPLFDLSILSGFIGVGIGIGVEKVPGQASIPTPIATQTPMGIVPGE